MQEFTTSDALEVDPSELAEIRVEAMKPSLEAVGRFDPQRARKRFLDSYDPKDTKIIHIGDDLVGFYVVREHVDHLYLDHIYIRPMHQGSGLGRQLVKAIQEQARARLLPVQLVALRESPANDFYLSCGFVLDRSDDLDNYYTWRPNVL